MFLSKSIKHYKRPEIRNAICEQATDKEIGVMFGIGTFGKRPDIIHYPDDVLEFAKKRVSSFHCSEELWIDPLSLNSNLKRKELNNLRKGWDFILDIDCPIWELSKLTTHLFIKVLEEHNIKGISCKFSGNKGFHVAVPYESFPKRINYQGKTVLVKNYFPEFPKLIAKYILNYVENKFTKIKDNSIYFLNKRYEFEELKKLFKLSFNEITYVKCANCGKIKKGPKETKITYLCDKCGNTFTSKEDRKYVICPKCKSIMRKVNEEKEKKECECGSTDFVKRLNLSKIIEVDTILIASRHMYRMPYSLHEKSELVSIPIKKEDVLSFNKDKAKPENVKTEISFLDRNVEQGEATEILQKALEIEEKETTNKRFQEKMFSSDKKSFDEYEIDQEAIPEEFFPPCIKNCHKGLEDGRKRVLFMLTNFLNSVNWSFDKIDNYLHKWNKTNEEELRENAIKTQIQYRKKRKKILPPNCDTQGYYKDLRICTPDEFCARIKNPAQYAKLKAKLNKKKRKRKKKEVKNKKKNENNQKQ